MKKFLALLLLALLLASPLSARAQRLSVVPGDAVEARGTVPSNDVIEFINGHAILPGSPECPRVDWVRYVPSAERIAEIRYWMRRAIEYDLDHGILTSPFGVAVARHLITYIPAVRFYDRPMFGWYRNPNTGEPYWICAQGVGDFDGPRVAADNILRTERLACYEPVNWYLGAIGRSDLWDSAYTQSIENAVGSQLTGGWRTN